MSIYVTPIPRLTAFAAPALTLGTANAAGTAETTISTDSTILAFDTTLPDAITFGQSGAVGSSTTAARRSHAHPMASDPAKLALIGTVVASNSSSITVTGLDSAYDSYIIELADIVAQNAGPEFWFRVGDSSGVDSGASDYSWASIKIYDTGNTVYGDSNSSASAIRLFGEVGNGSGEGIGASLVLHRPGDGTTEPMISGSSTGMGLGNELRSRFIGGRRKAVITLDRVNVLFSSGNIVSGRMTVWGLVHD